jgi:HlyD family secretion protein
VEEWSGRKVQVGDTVFATRLVAHIPDLSSLRVQAWVSETHVQQVKAGQDVDLYLDAYPDNRFRGIIAEVSQSAEAVRRWGKSNYFKTDIQMDKLDPDIMKPGMSVKCDVHGAPHKDVLLIPLQMTFFDGRSFWIKPERGEPLSVIPLGFDEFVLAASPEENPGLKAGHALQPVEGLKAKEETGSNEGKAKVETALNASRGAFLLLFACSPSGKPRVVRVVRGPFDIKIHATGQLQSAASYYVGCPSVERMWQYTISFMAPEGKPVGEGDPILTFDSRELMQRLQLKQSELDTGMKELERIRLQEQQTLEDFVLQTEEAKVRTQKARQKADVPEGLIAPNELQKLKMDLELAELQEKLAVSRVENQKSGMKTRIHVQDSKVTVLKNEVEKLNRDIQAMNCTAPKPGIVVYTPDWDGKKKAVGDTCWMGENILELPDLSRMQMKAVILESQAGRVKAGQKADVRLDANPDRVFKGTVVSLGRIFRVKSDSQPAIVFDAVIDLSESDPQLMRPGMAAGVDITISSKENVLQLAEAALVYQEGGVAVRKKGRLSDDLTPVTIGARSAGVVEVLSGLNERDEVVIRTGGREGGR